MKKKKANQQRQAARMEWKDAAENEIMDMQTEMDELADELGLSEETILRFEKIVDKFKGKLNEAIDLFEVTPAIAEQTKGFMENYLDEIYHDRIIASDYNMERMIDITTMNCAGQYIKTPSLSEQIRLDDFLATLQENPYQLKLIA